MPAGFQYALLPPPASTNAIPLPFPIRIICGSYDAVDGFVSDPNMPAGGEGHLDAVVDNDVLAPGWLVEGMADYYRWFKYEPQSHGADIIWMQHQRNFTSHHDSSYRVSANFLDWVTQKYDPNIVTEVNADLRAGKYSDDFWEQHTGKTVQDLGAEWQKDIEAQSAK